MARTDAHRPSAIIPADYEFVAFEYLRIDGLGDAAFLQQQRIMLRNHMQRTGGTYSGQEHGGNCGVCGSANAIYTAMFFHKPTNAYVRTGLDCAEKLECRGVAAFRKNCASALEAKAGKRKAEAVLAEANLSAAWALYVQGQQSATELPREETALCDIVNRLVQYGSLSVPQMAFLRRLVDQIANRAVINAQRAAEHAKAKPLPVSDKRITVRGTVISIKVPNYERGECGPVRMLVQHKDGWKVWGSLPSNLTGLQKGAAVEFDAAVKVSDKDEKFGFFKRPTKARESEAA